MTKKDRGSVVPASTAENQQVLSAPGSRDKTRGRIIAEACLSPIVGNAVIARTFMKGGVASSDLTDSVAVIAEFAAKAQKNDLSDAEAMLMAQAAALNAVFTELARRAAVNMGEYLQATETYLRLALKAQAQCRATLQTLAEIKNPHPVAFVKQRCLARARACVPRNSVTDGFSSRHRAERSVSPYQGPILPFAIMR
jgi:hypothetical protein